MPTIFQKIKVDKTVYELALERLERVYELHDNVIVSFSGGKDSTALLNLTIEVATTLKKLPVDVVFWDEEAIAPETHDYVNRVRQRDDVNLRWLAVPVTHRNGCSTISPYWYPWAEEDRHLWVRDMPEWAEATLPGNKRHTIPAANGLLVPRDGKVTAVLTGVRADESVNRYRSVAMRTTNNWFSPDPYAKGSVVVAKPIYDWRTVDVWVGPHEFGWDYNRAYDLYDKAGISPSQQRVAPPYGEQPMKSLWMYQVCHPELWDKMVARVPGAATAARYAQTEMYGMGSNGKEMRPPDGMSWQEGIRYYISRHPDYVQADIATRLRGFMATHQRLAKRDIPEIEPDPITGLSWRFMLRTALRGDLKGRDDPSFSVSNAGIREATAEATEEGRY